MEPGTEQWERVKSLFDGALRRPPSERERFLVERCPDEEIRLEVLSLLRNDESARVFLPSNPEQNLPPIRTQAGAMSAIGTSRTSGDVRLESAKWAKADA